MSNRRDRPGGHAGAAVVLFGVIIDENGLSFGALFPQGCNSLYSGDVGPFLDMVFRGELRTMILSGFPNPPTKFILAHMVMTAILLQQ